MEFKIQTELGLFQEWLDDIDLYSSDEKLATNDSLLKAYEKALDAFKEFASKGKCKVEYVPVERKSQYHSIRVSWIPDENGFVEPDTQTLIQGLREMELLINEETPLNWQVGCEIYSPI